MAAVPQFSHNVGSVLRKLLQFDRKTERETKRRKDTNRETSTGCSAVIIVNACCRAHHSNILYEECVKLVRQV